VNPKSGSPVTLVSTVTLADGTTSTLTRSNVILRQITPYAVTLQPGATGLDTYIRSSPANTNYGADVSMLIQAGTGRGLVKFDLSSIPAGSDIRSAQLSLYHTNGGSDPVSAFRATRPWTEGTGAAGSGASWASADGVEAWTTAGGDYDPASGVAITLSPNGTWSTWDLTAQTAAWVAGIQPNYGIALIAASGGANTFTSSDDAANPTLRPRLALNFLPPCGWVPPATGVTFVASQDTWIDASGSGAANYGGSSSFTVTNASKAGRALVRFDLSTVPPGTLLTSATLRLWVGSFSPKADSVLTVYKVHDPWVEGTRNGSGSADGATWKTRDGSLGWSAGFGIVTGFDSGVPTSATTLPSSFSSGWVEWNVTPLAQRWIDGVSPNYGAAVMINTASEVIFNSREWSIYQPKLVLTY